jgi:SulP family sulfate permease
MSADYPDCHGQLSAGFVAGLSALTNCFAFGALIFSGLLHPFLSQGIAASLLTCGATAFVIALTSRFRIAIAAPTAGISALLAVLMASLAPAMSDLPPQQILALAYAALFTATAAVAATLLLLGFIRAGKLVRFIPYPVIAGFMGATGWLVIAGAVKMATDVSVDLVSLPIFAHPREGRLLAILLIWTAVLWVLTKRIKHSLTLPVALILAFTCDGSCPSVFWNFRRGRA